MKQKLALVLLAYFRFLAKLQLKKFAPDIIGITGSAGKTTTRNAVKAMLLEKYQLRVSEKANSESGIPLHILGLSPHDYSFGDWLRLAVLAPLRVLFYWEPFEKYIVEMGIDSPNPPKNMSYLLTIVKPRTAIFLNAYPVHSFAFDHLIKTSDAGERLQAVKEKIAAEKGKLITALPANGLAILNADDPLVKAFGDKTDAQVMTFGKDEQATARLESVSYSHQSTQFSFATPSGKIKMQFPYLLPEHYAYSLAAAICIGIDEGMTAVEITDTMHRNFRLEPGRMGLFAGINQTTIIDSSYNASAEPTIEALRMLEKLQASRKIAVLGDMRELGQVTKAEHERVMDAAMKYADRIILVGPLMKEFALPYLTKHNFTDTQWFETSTQAGNWLKGSLSKNDLILFKGSQNSIFLEMAIEHILARKADADLLCRRGEYWEKVRSL